MLAIFAPTSTDDEYFRELISKMTAKNSSDQCAAISKLLETSKEISRKEAVPVLEKVIQFVETGNIDQATEVLYTFNRQEKVFFKSNELNPLFKVILSNNELHKSTVIPPLLSLCDKAIHSYEDLIKITNTPNDLAELVPLASNQYVISFFVKIAQVDSSIRVPLVFNGLIEQILPTISSNEIHLSLLALLMSDKQTRKYFIDMGHVPRLLDALFQTNISNTATEAFSCLLSSNDLTNLPNAQRCVFEDGAFDRLLDVAQNQTIDDETAGNAIKCISCCVYCHKLDKFDTKWILNVAARRAGCRSQLLNLAEKIAMSNPSLMFRDKDVVEIEDIKTDLVFMMHLSYICHDCYRSSCLDLTKLVASTREEKAMKLALSIQRKIFDESASLQAIDPGDSILQKLSCVLCLICRRCGDRRGAFIQNAVELFEKPPTEISLPNSFISWGLGQFSRSRIGFWMKDTAPLVEMKTESVFDRSPADAANEVGVLNTTANNVMIQNRRLRTHCNTLIEEKKESENEYIEIEKALISTRCGQLSTHINI